MGMSRPGKGIVRIYRRVCRRRYKAQQAYAYERLYVPVPARFRELVESFLGRDLEVEVRVEANRLLIVASPAAEFDPMHP